jgi:hypothetical protein
MSKTVHVKLSFGNEHIRYGSEGVDLGEFNSDEKEIKRATKRTWGA